MSDNVLDKFLIALGFDVDKKSTQEAEKSIDGIRSNALKMGTALAGALIGAGYAATRTAREITNLKNEAELLANVSVSELDAFQHVFAQAGGSPGEAASTFSNFQWMLANAQLKGEGPWEDLELSGVLQDILLETSTSIELLMKLANLFPQLGEQQQIFAAKALGLSPGAELLLREGPEALDRHLDDAYTRGVVSEEQAERAQELTRANANLGRTTRGAWREFADAITPGLTGMVEDYDQVLLDIGFRSKSRDVGDIVNDNIHLLGPTPTSLFGSKSFIGRYGAWLDDVMPDNEFLRFMFTPSWRLPGFRFNSEDEAPLDGPDALNPDAPSPAPSDELGFRLPDPSASSVFYETRDSVMPPLAAPANSTTNETVHIDRIELNVDGTGDPAAVADRVMAELNDVMLASLAQFQTASAG